LLVFPQPQSAAIHPPQHGVISCPDSTVGEIRVLCNHTVLSTGFDAPKTDMILISRAVFSPVRYMQMVGRGLRGEKNGGKARCRIVTVLDNLGRFQDRHPYHYCQVFFSENTGSV
jgi:superfamily II DNA or RNA helicase